MHASVDMEFTLQPLFELGRGGMAVVRAERLIDARGKARLVAVKRLLPMVAEVASTRNMFLEEARLAAHIDHPNVVGILAQGQDEEPFIVMDLVLGETLASIVSEAQSRAQPPLDPYLALYVAAELCDALHAAHELSDPDTGEPVRLVHRDVSPQNILIGFDGTVRLTDFGIAKALGFGARTRTGEVKGKVPYMSPEQAMCDEMDRRSDLFALGSVLYECMSGQRMMGGGNEIDILRKLTTEAPPSLDGVWPDAPTEIVDLHAQLAARQIDDRPSTAAEVANRIRAVLSVRAPNVGPSDLRDRMTALFPRRLEQLEQRLATAQDEAARMQPYLDDLEELTHRPSMIHRERRRGRTMLFVGLAFMGAAVALIVALAVSDRGSRSHFSPPNQDPASNESKEPSAVDTPPALVSPGASLVETSPAANSHDPRTPSSGADKRLAPGRALPSRASTKHVGHPPPAPPTRNDKLDENPF